MMTAQWAPWFDFRLITRVPAYAFTPKPCVDGGILATINLTDRSSLQSTMDRNDIRGDTLPRDLTPDQWAGLYSALGPTDQSAPSRTPKSATRPSAARKQSRSSQEKGMTMHNDKSHKTPSTPTTTGELPSITEKPVITGEFPIVGADQIAKKLEAQIPGVEPEVTTKSHDKGHLQAERGFMPQHGKKSQPQPRWNLPRR